MHVLKVRQAGYLEQAEQLLHKALPLDPKHHKMCISLVRVYLAIGERGRVLEVAKQIGALMMMLRLNETPIVDGNPAEAAWQHVFTTNHFYRASSRLSSLRAKQSSEFFIGNRDVSLWKDDCAELFFKPVGTGDSFIQFIINAGGVIFDLIESDRKTNFDYEYATTIVKPRDDWCAELAIDATPLDKVGVTSQSLWGINIVRTRMDVASGHCQYWPTLGTTTSLHLFPFAGFGNP